jgi:hypothetical protein
MKEHQVMIKCDCYSHAIEVEYMEDPDEITYINLWYMGRGNDWHLKDKLVAAWRMLTEGYVIDGFLLNREKVVQLRDALNVILDEPLPTCVGWVDVNNEYPE